MLRIGIECHNLENRRWGIGHHLANLLAEIARQADQTSLAEEFKFFLYFKGQIPPDSFLDHPVFVKRVLKPRWWLWRPSFNFFFHLLLPWAYRQDQLDGMFFASFMLPLFFSGRSLVVLTNDIYYEYTQGVLPWRYKLGYRLFANWAAKRATKITTYTQSAKGELTKLFKIKPERIGVNYLGLGQHFKTTTLKHPAAKQPYLLYIGQAFPRRRAKEIMEAFSLLAPLYPKLRLFLVGQDKYPQPLLKKLAVQLNQQWPEPRIIYREYIADNQELIKLYRGAKLFIYLSSSEALGLPPLEALAAGTPSLLKDNALNREIYGSSAFFVSEETNPQSIAREINRALQDTAQQKEILRQAPEILRQFSWEKHLQRFLDEWKK